MYSKNISESKPNWIETLVENNIISAIVHIKDFTLKKINTIQNLPNNVFNTAAQSTSTVPFTSPLSKVMLKDNDLIPESPESSSSFSHKLKLDKTFSPSSQVRVLDTSLSKTVKEHSSSTHNESRRLKFKNSQMERMEKSGSVGGVIEEDNSSKRSSRKFINRTTTPLELGESLMSKLEEIAKQQDEESKSMTKSQRSDENNESYYNNINMKRSKHQRNRSNLCNSNSSITISPKDKEEREKEQTLTPNVSNEKKSKLSKGNVLSLKNEIKRDDSSNSSASCNKLPIPPTTKLNKNEMLEQPPPPNTTEDNTDIDQQGQGQGQHYYRGQRRASTTEIENKIVDNIKRKTSRRKSTTSVDSTSKYDNSSSNNDRKKSVVSSEVSDSERKYKHHHHHHHSRKTSKVSETSESVERKDKHHNTNHHHHHHHHKNKSKTKSRSSSKDEYKHISNDNDNRKNSSIADDEKEEKEENKEKKIEKMDIIHEAITPEQTPLHENPNPNNNKPLVSPIYESIENENRDSIKLDTVIEMLKDPLKESISEMKVEHPNLQIDDSSSDDDDDESESNKYENKSDNNNNNENLQNEENEESKPKPKLSLDKSNPSSRTSPSLPPKFVNNMNSSPSEKCSDLSDTSFKITKEDENEAIETYKMFSNSIESRSKLLSAKAKCASIHLSGNNVRRFPHTNSNDNYNNDDRPMIPKFATEFSRSNSAVSCSTRNNSDFTANNNNNFDRRFSPHIGAYRKSPLGKAMINRPESLRLTPLIPPLDINNANPTNLNAFNVTTGVIGSSLNRTGRTFHRMDDSGNTFGNERLSPIVGNNNNDDNDNHSTIHNVSGSASINANTPKVHNITLKGISPNGIRKSSLASLSKYKNSTSNRKISEMNYSDEILDNNNSVNENRLSFGNKLSQHKLSKNISPNKSSDHRRRSTSSYYDSTDEEIVYFPRAKNNNINPVSRTRLSTQYIRITPTYSIRSKTPFILIDRVVIRTIKLMVSNAPSDRVKTNIQLQISIGDSLPYLLDQINSTDKELHNITKECLCELYGKDNIVDSLQIENILLILHCDVLMIIWRASHALLSYIQLHYTEQELISTCIEKIDLFMEILHKLIDRDNKEEKVIGDINEKQKKETIDNFIEVLTTLIKDPSSSGEIWNSHTDSGEEGLEILFQLITVNELCSQQSLSNIANILLYFIQSDGMENMIAYSARRVYIYLYYFFLLIFIF